MLLANLQRFEDLYIENKIIAQILFEIGNITIDNVKDQPGLPRTDDINTILHNFVEYYSKLNEHKKICSVALDRLIKNLTLMLETEEAEELNKPITGKEMLSPYQYPKGQVPRDGLPSI
jgi:hypothetical protein